MKKIALTLITPLIMSASSLNELKTLSSEQKAVMVKTFKMAKVHDLQWTMTAIAWKESGFGKALVGRTTPDYGVFQINLNTYKRRFHDEIVENDLSEKEIIETLKYDFETGFIAALEEIYFWKKVRKDDWRMVWASYNDGTYISSKGKKYSEDIAKRIKLLKIYFKNKS